MSQRAGLAIKTLSHEAAQRRLCGSFVSWCLSGEILLNTLLPQHRQGDERLRRLPLLARPDQAEVPGRAGLLHEDPRGGRSGAREVEVEDRREVAAWIAEEGAVPIGFVLAFFEERPENPSAARADGARSIRSPLIR